MYNSRTPCKVHLFIIYYIIKVLKVCCYYKLYLKFKRMFCGQCKYFYRICKLYDSGTVPKIFVNYIYNSPQSIRLT